MKKFLIVLAMVAMASFLLVGCDTGTTPVTPVTTVEPVLQLTGITVDPKTMDLLTTGEGKTITSVTATYEVKGYGTDVDLGECIYLSSDLDVATVEEEDSVVTVTAVAKGTATILVSYEGKIDTLEVTVKRAITINWLEDGSRYYPDGTLWYSSINDPLGPAILVQDGEGWYFADANDWYNYSDLVDFEGSIVINGTGQLSGDATYESPASSLPIEDNLLGQVEIIVYEDGISGTMVGTCSQWGYAFGTGVEVTAKYPKAVPTTEIGKWFVQYTDYISSE